VAVVLALVLAALSIFAYAFYDTRKRMSTKKRARGAKLA
jgi:hypothetical protein